LWRIRIPVLGPWRCILDQPFTVDNGQLTPTLKLRRSAIEAAHAARITAIYRD
jgi:long-chain acyl-CoA synthetase